MGNSYIDMRDNFEEIYSTDSHLDICIADVWFPDKTRVDWWKDSYPKHLGKTINILNLNKIKVSADGQEVDLMKNNVAGLSVKPDMQHDVLSRSFTMFGVRFDVCKFLSVAQKELTLIRWKTISIDDKTHQIRIDSIIDVNMKNEDSSYEEKFWQVLDKRVPDDHSHVATRTVASSFGVEQLIVGAEQAFTGSFKALGGSQTG